MKAISLWQPWASLLFTTPRTKIHETRHWGTSHRGYMYIHAAKRPIREFDLDPRLEDLCMEVFGDKFRKNLPFGAIIGMVKLIDCMRTESVAPHTTTQDLLCGDFSPGRFAWSMAVPTPIGPWPYKGQQGMWAISEYEIGMVANRCLGIPGSPLCFDCPPENYPTDKTRCKPCPRRLHQRPEVMNPPASAAQGAEARNLNMGPCHGTGVVPRGAKARPADASPPPNEWDEYEEDGPMDLEDQLEIALDRAFTPPKAVKHD